MTFETILALQNFIEPGLVIDMAGRVIQRKDESDSKCCVIPYAQESIGFMEQDVYSLAFVKTFDRLFSFVFDSQKALSAGFGHCSFVQKAYPGNSVRVYLADFVSDETTIKRTEVLDSLTEFRDLGELSDITTEFLQLGGVSIRYLSDYIIVTGRNSMFVASASGSVKLYNKSPYINFDIEFMSNSFKSSNAAWQSSFKEAIY